MAFRLKSTESVANGLRRLAREELRSISRHLDGAVAPHGTALHEIRKSVKKTRAILGVIRADHGRGLTRSGRRLHAVNSRLSALRDADVMLETLRALRNKDRRILNDRCFARVRRRLSGHKDSVMKAASREGIWRRVGRSIRKVRQDARHWKPDHRQFGALAAGIRLAHQRGRKAMAIAAKSEAAAECHEWRKQIKALWYELRLLEEAGSRIRQDVAALHRAEVWLGNEHNAAVLCDELSKDAPGGESRIDLDRVRLVADRYRCEMRTKALTGTKRIYAQPAREYAIFLRGEWERWHTG